jgi:uncharacterized protein (TIGR02001 family)
MLIAGLAIPARAQLGVSASVDSDERPRGVSLSDGGPVASLNLTWDDASGVYAGASATTVATRRSGLEVLGDVIYLGYSRRLNPTTSWDVGVSNSVVAVYVQPTYRANYTEMYAGITAGPFSSHVYYSPDYLGEGARTLYGEVNGAFPLSRRWRLLAHVGVLNSLGGARVPYAGRTRYDARLGVARELGALQLRLALSATSSGVDFPEGHSQSRTALILGAAYAF